MRTTRRLGWALAILLATATGAAAQIPGAAPPAAVPGAPSIGGAPAATGAGVGGTSAAGTTAGAAGAAPAAAPAAAPRNIWGFFMMTPDQKKAHAENSAICKAKFCASRIGQFANNMLLPAGAVTGGLLGPICPGPLSANPADLAKPATSPQGAAARIKAEEAQAKAKVEAIEFLATVDCRYYPEAEAGLIVGLRAEKNECVRLAAAKALASGCCCTAKIVKALLIAVSCSTEDKFPAERSELVKVYAYVALERCLRKCIEGEPEPSPEPPAAAKQAVYETLTPFGPLSDYATAILMVSYFVPGGTENPQKIYADARVALGRGLHLSPQTIARLSGPKNVMATVAPELGGVRSASLFEKMEARGLMPSFAAKPAAQTETVVHASFVPEPAKPAKAKLPLPPPTEPDPPTAAKPTRGSLLDIFQETRKR